MSFSKLLHKLFSTAPEAEETPVPTEEERIAAAKAADESMLELAKNRRQEAIDHALTLPLLDGVLHIMYANTYPRALIHHRSVERISIREVFPAITEEELKDVISRASDLQNSAFDACDRFGFEVALEKLMHDHPGFEYSSYTESASYGMFQAR